MPEVRFTLDDKVGRPRKGRVTVVPDGASQVKRAEPYHFGRLAFLAYQLAAKLPPSFTLRKFFATSAALGLLWAVLNGLWFYGHLRVAMAPSPVPIPVNVTILGQVSMPGIQDFGDVWVVLDFPQIPAQISKPWSELEHPSPGRFKLQAGFLARREPRDCIVKISKPHYQTGFSGLLNLRTQKPSYAVDVELHPELPRSSKNPK